MLFRSQVSSSASELSMWPHVDASHPRQPEHTYPLSPPSSASVTAHSSPKLSPLTPNDPPYVGQSFAPSPVFRRANSQATKSWKQQTSDGIFDSDEDVMATARYARESPLQSTSSSSHLSQKKANRAITMPTLRTSTDRTQAKSPSKAARPLFHKSSYSSSSSSSSTDSNVLASTPANSGIGRKVAATLQLFKETTGGEDLKLRESIPEVSIGRHKSGQSHIIEDVPKAQYEFVKRSEWPDRETAAIRREKSTTGLSRVRTRDSTTLALTGVDDAEPSRGRERKVSVRDTVINDLTQWRKDVMHRQDAGRGRRLERASNGTSLDPEISSPGSLVSTSTASAPRDLRELNLPSPSTQSRSRVYPSPSRSPFDRNPHSPLSNLPTEPTPSSSAFHTPAHEVRPRDGVRLHPRSPTPIQISSPTTAQKSPLYSLPGPASLPTPTDPPHSPWSTDDESGWETASATTSMSTTSATSLHPLSHLQMNPRPYLHYSNDANDKERDRRFLPSENRLHELNDDPLDDADNLDLELEMGLPHIPLRPFRNQVGGHSAIYKFTKRAVCKVCLLFLFLFVHIGLTTSNARYI